jgi:hypothetical protein
MAALRASLPVKARSTEVGPEMEAYARNYLAGFLSIENNSCQGGKKQGQWYCAQYTKKVNNIMKLTREIKARRTAAAAAAAEVTQNSPCPEATATISPQSNEF